MRPMKRSETPRSSTMKAICSTRPMAMMVTSAMEMARATIHSVRVSLSFLRSRWRSASLSSSCSKMAS